MIHNFDEIVSRRATNSYKWDTSERGVLPMWVADMDFRTAPSVTAALRLRVEHGIFGYAKVPDAYYDAVISWFSRLHGWTMEREWIIYTTGVVPALSATIRALTSPGDKVLVQTPVYNCFFSSIQNNGCEVVTNPLIYQDGTYRIDFDDLALQASDPSVKLMLLCNPHNPVGRVWTREELTTLGNICLDNNVFVIADEIHCDLVYCGSKYTPFGSISDRFLQHSATCTSPSKAFNLAGLQIANITIADDCTRTKVNRAINIHEVCDVNPFGIEALIAAYNDGELWLRELLLYLHANYRYARGFFESRLPHLALTPLEGTYLLWVDCSALGRSSQEIVRTLHEEQKVLLNDGSLYGVDGQNFVRINIACPREVVVAGLDRLLPFFGGK